MAILYNENHKIDFFIKRIKRILPAYFMTIILIFLLVVFLTTNREFESVAKQSIFGMFFSSNIGFWLDTPYFDKAEFKPLLHLWSLGVEIQFYLLVPLLFWAIRRSKSIFLIIFLGSLISCFVILEVSPKTSFFMTPFRLWEFLIGYASAKYFSNNGVIIKKTPWIGTISFLVLLAIPLMGVEGEALNFVYGHPGMYSLIVCIATAGVLSNGLPSYIENTLLGSLVERIGKYSYSIYLVHFPVIVLFLYKPFSGTVLKANSLSQLVIILGMILILSLLMYRFVEKPSVSRKKVKKLWLVFPSSIILIFLLGITYQQFKYSKEEMLIFQSWADRDTYRCGKIMRITNPFALSCELTQKMEDPDQNILLVGNSHADSIKLEFTKVANFLNTRVFFLVGNEPLMPRGINAEEVLSEAMSKNIDTIVMHYSPNTVDNDELIKFINSAASENINVKYIMPVPVWGQHISRVLWRNIVSNDALPSQNIGEYNNYSAELRDRLSAITSKRFTLYPVGEVFCQPQCMLMNNEGKPLYFDAGHLTLSGSALLNDLFVEIIENR